MLKIYSAELFLYRSLRHTITYIAIYIFLLVTLVALIRYFSPWRQTVPEADIIYVPRTEASQLGFVNADGSNSSLITLGNCTLGRFVFTLGGCRYESLSQPVWSADGRYVYGLTGPLSYYIASPAYWDTWKGSMKYCSRRDLPYFLQVEGAGNPENPAEVLIGNVGSILRMDLDTCAYQTIFDYPPGEYPTEGFSYNPTTQVFLYGLTSATIDPNHKLDFHVIKYDPKTGEKVALAEGVKPSWSPDGAWLLYTGCGQVECKVDSLYKVPALGGPAVLLATDMFSGSGSWRP